MPQWRDGELAILRVGAADQLTAHQLAARLRRHTATDIARAARTLGVELPQEAPASGELLAEPPAANFPLDVPVRPFAVRIPAPMPGRREGRSFRAVVYGDTHVPFQDPAALRVVQGIVRDVKPDVLLNVGDLVDSWQISRFDKDPARRDTLQDNIDEARQHLAEMAQCAPAARRVLLEGNHEARLTKAIWRLEGAARELPRLRIFQREVTWPRLLELEAVGWEWVPTQEQSRTAILPKIITKHGEVVRKWSGSTARGEWERYGRSGLSGHTHRLGDFLRRDHNGVARWVETGCTCLLEAPYGVDFDWIQGCVVIAWNADRRLMQVELVPIRDGAAIHRDTIYHPE